MPKAANLYISLCPTYYYSVLKYKKKENVVVNGDQNISKIYKFHLI